MANYKRQPVYDTTKGTVHVWSKNGVIPAYLRYAIDPRVELAPHSHTNSTGGPSFNADDSPSLGHLRDHEHVLYVHGGNDCPDRQRMAARVNSRFGAISMPAATAWLQAQVAAVVTQGVDVDIVVGGGAW